MCDTHTDTHKCDTHIDTQTTHLLETETETQTTRVLEHTHVDTHMYATHIDTTKTHIDTTNLLETEAETHTTVCVVFICVSYMCLCMHLRRHMCAHVSVYASHKTQPIHVSVLHVSVSVSQVSAVSV